MKLNALLLLALTLWMCKSILNSCRLSLRCDTVTEICNAVEMHYKVFESIKCSMRFSIYRWHKKTGTFEKPNKNWRNPRKNKIIDKNWTIATCLLRESNPDYQCLKITSCRWRPPPRMHSFTATTHFKSSRSFVSLCVCCMLCRMRHAECHRPATSWMHYTTNCNTQSSAPEDG